MSEPIDICKNLPHFNIMALCLSCSHRWIGLVVARTSLFQLECPRCGAQNSFATFIPDEYLEELV